MNSGKKGIIFILAIGLVISGLLYFYINNQYNGNQKMTHDERLRKVEKKRFKKLKDVFVELTQLEGSRLANNSSELIRSVLQGGDQISFIKNDKIYFCKGLEVSPPLNYAIKINKIQQNFENIVKVELKKILRENRDMKDFDKSARAAPFKVLFNKNPSEIKSIDDLNFEKIPSTWEEFSDYSDRIIKFYNKHHPNYLTSDYPCPSKENAYVISKEKFDSLPITLKGVDMKKHAKPVE